MILKIEKKCWLLLAIVVCITSFTGIETVYAVNKTAVTSRDEFVWFNGRQAYRQVFLYSDVYIPRECHAHSSSWLRIAT